MPTLTGQSSSKERPTENGGGITPDQGTSTRRILPSGPVGWATLVLAVATLVGALTELAKVVIGG